MFIDCNLIAISVTDQDIVKESNEYDRMRLENMKRNQEYLLSIGINPGWVTDPVTPRLIQKDDTDGFSEGEPSSVDSEESSDDEYFEDVTYDIIETFSDTFRFPTPKTTTLLNSPSQEYWSYIDRVFLDKDDGIKYTVDFVVRAEPLGWYLFEYVALDAAGERVKDDAEELRTACHEMVSESCKWVEWGGVMKKK